MLLITSHVIYDARRQGAEDVLVLATTTTTSTIYIYIYIYIYTE